MLAVKFMFALGFKWAYSVFNINITTINIENISYGNME